MDVLLRTYVGIVIEFCFLLHAGTSVRLFKTAELLDINTIVNAMCVAEHVTLNIISLLLLLTNLLP